MYTDNFFYNNWLTSQNEIENQDDILISYNLALENIEDLQYINSNKEDLQSIDVKKIISFNNEKNYALLIIYFTGDKVRAYLKTYIENKKIDKNIELKIFTDDDTRTYAEAIPTLKEQITQIWKGQNLVDVSAPSFLNLFLDVKQINDYLRLRSIFDSIDLIENYSVLEMTNDRTKVRLKYKGKINKLRDKIFENNIDIKIINNTWRVTIN